MHLDIAVEFFRSYLQAEHEEEVAVYAESDEVLAKRRANSESFMYTAGGMSSALGRPPLAHGKPNKPRAAANVVPRVLFLVAEYKHPTLGRVFAAYVGGSRSLTATAYEQLLYAAEIDGQLKLIAKYMEDFLDLDSPMRWAHMQGEEVGDLGGALVTRSFAQPDRKRHRDEWNKICQLGG